MYLLITYFMTNQPLEAERIFKVLLLGILVTMMAQALGHAFGAAFDAQVGRRFLLQIIQILLTKKEK